MSGTPPTLTASRPTCREPRKSQHSSAVNAVTGDSPTAAPSPIAPNVDRPCRLGKEQFGEVSRPQVPARLHRFGVANLEVHPATGDSDGTDPRADRGCRAPQRQSAEVVQ